MNMITNTVKTINKNICIDCIFSNTISEEYDMYGCTNSCGPSALILYPIYKCLQFIRKTKNDI